MLKTDEFPQINTAHILRAIPGIYLIIAPDLSILDATDAYLKVTRTTRENITGKNITDAFPGNTSNTNPAPLEHIKRTIQLTLDTKVSQTLPTFRYDGVQPAEQGALYEERYWTTSTHPVITPEGQVSCLIMELREATEEVQQELNKQINREQLAMLTNATHAVSWEYDMEHNTMHWGGSLQEVFGYTPQDMGPGGESWDNRVHPDDFPAMRDSINQATSMGSKIWTGEYRFLKADNTYAHVLDQGFIIYSKGGKPIRTIGSIIDITKNKQAEQQLKESNARFQHLLEVLPHMAWTAAPNGRILYFNENWYSYTGMQKGQLEGWVGVVHPEDSAHAVTSWREACQSGVLYEIEYRLRNHLDGTYRWFLERGVPMYDENGQVKLWIGTYTDIEEQKQALEQLRIKDQHLEDILKLSPAHLCLLHGPQHICTFVTPGVYNVYGNRHYLGRTAVEIWPELLELGFENLLNQVYQRADVVRIDEFKISVDKFNRKQPQDAFFNFTYQPLLDNNGKVQGILISAIEVTTLVETKRKAEQLAQKLQQRLNT